MQVNQMQVNQNDFSIKIEIIYKERFKRAVKEYIKTS